MLLLLLLLLPERKRNREEEREDFASRKSDQEDRRTREREENCPGVRRPTTATTTTVATVWTEVVTRGQTDRLCGRGRFSEATASPRLEHHGTGDGTRARRLSEMKFGSGRKTVANENRDLRGCTSELVD